jgi:hypothetical protein
MSEICGKSYWDTTDPVSLTWLQIRDNCQFCENPRGSVFTFSTSFNPPRGFISCNHCKTIASSAKENWANKNS